MIWFVKKEHEKEVPMFSCTKSFFESMNSLVRSGKAVSSPLSKISRTTLGVQENLSLMTSNEYIIIQLDLERRVSYNERIIMSNERFWTE